MESRAQTRAMSRSASLSGSDSPPVTSDAESVASQWLDEIPLPFSSPVKNRRGLTTGEDLEKCRLIRSVVPLELVKFSNEHLSLLPRGYVSDRPSWLEVLVPPIWNTTGPETGLYQPICDLFNAISNRLYGTHLLITTSFPKHLISNTTANPFPIQSITRNARSLLPPMNRFFSSTTMADHLRTVRLG